MKGNPFADHEWPSEMEEWKGASMTWFGCSSTEFGGINGTTPPHLVRHATLERQTYGGKEMYAKSYCGTGFRDGTLRCFPRKDWELRNSHKMSGAPLRYCGRCWKAFHAENKLAVPVQEKFDPLEAHYIRHPVRELVNGSTGERVMPYLILQEKHWGGSDNGRGDTAGYMKSDLKADGTPKYNASPMRIHQRYGSAGWAFVDESVESEASELRAEIAMHRRKLAEASKLLHELYKEAQDPDLLAEWDRPDPIEAPDNLVFTEDGSDD